MKHARFTKGGGDVEAMRGRVERALWFSWTDGDGKFGVRVNRDTPRDPTWQTFAALAGGTGGFPNACRSRTPAKVSTLVKVSVSRTIVTSTGDEREVEKNRRHLPGAPSRQRRVGRVRPL